MRNKVPPRQFDKMPTFGSSFSYETYKGVVEDVAVYCVITFLHSTSNPIYYDEAKVDLKSGKITFYTNDTYYKSSFF